MMKLKGMCHCGLLGLQEMIDAERALQKVKCRTLAVEVVGRETEDCLTHQDEIHYCQILNGILFLQNREFNFRLPYMVDGMNTE